MLFLIAYLANVSETEVKSEAPPMTLYEQLSIAGFLLADFCLLILIVIWIMDMCCNKPKVEKPKVEDPSSESELS
jgi:hypothetical protein